RAGCPVLVVDSAVLPGAQHVGAPALLEAIGEIVAPDARADHPDVGVLHRSLAGGEVYLVVNTGPRPVRTRLRPRTSYVSWETWDAHSGAVTQRSSGAILLALAPYEATTVITSPRAGAPVTGTE